MKIFKRLSLFRPQIVVIILFLFLLYFWIDLGIIAFNRAFKNLNDLCFVEGKITDARIIKHIQESKHKTSVLDVLVLNVEGTNDEFGFLQFTDAFKKLLTSRKIGKTARIYYDSSGKRIEENVTLHTYDMALGNFKVLDLEDSKKGHRLYAFLFLAIPLLIITLILVSIWRSRKRRQSLSKTAG